MLMFDFYCVIFLLSATVRQGVTIIKWTVVMTVDEFKQIRSDGNRKTAAPVL